jgi:diketogulonate reductase-like aldo/keto reductase
MPHKSATNLEINLNQAAKYLGVSNFRVHRLIARGEIKARYEKNEKNIQKSRWFIDFDSLIDFMKREKMHHEV